MDNNYKYTKANNLPQGFSFSIDIIFILIISGCLGDLLEINKILLMITFYLIYTYIEYEYTTLGKLIFSHKVLNKDFSKSPFWKILYRNIIKLPFFLFWFVISLQLCLVICIMFIIGVNFNKLGLNSFTFFYDKLLEVEVYKKSKFLTNKENELEITEDNLENLVKNKTITFLQFTNQLNKRLSKLDKNEIIIISIVIGSIFFIILGYTFGERQYFNGIGKRINQSRYYETSDFSTSVSINYVLGIIGFIITSGISYLYLNSKRKK